ncbi:MAG: Gfo/Idh/MocA family oxidoreductase, partial [Planctomycetes bacterium]|nr:Gfo/Idh/MocA family oxidoreductase [Planctomycetota bacterium]
MHRIAIIGTGAIADSHIQAYARCGAPCAVAALVDLYPEKARAKAAKHGLNAAVFKSCDEMLAAGGGGAGPLG